jgi:hypothetical protein
MIKKWVFLFLFVMVAFGYQEGWQALNGSSEKDVVS